MFDKEQCVTIGIIEPDRLSYAGKALSLEMVIGFRIIGQRRKSSRALFFTLYIYVFMYSIPRKLIASKAISASVRDTSCHSLTK